jgi:hypothetical protein
MYLLEAKILSYLTKKMIKVKESGAALEVRYDELSIASPSIHGDGNPWTVLQGVTEGIPNLMI